MKTLDHRFRLLLLCLAIVSANALTASAAEKPVIKVWPKTAPGETGKIGPEKTLPPRGKKKVIRLTNVTAPTLTVFRPEKGKANGCAVIVCPGGGYSILAWDLEGTEVAEWLNSIGVTAFVLKYRVPRRDPDNPHRAPLQDLQRAIRLVRANAQSYGVDPKRVGVLGFSAGGHLTVMSGTHWDESTYKPIDSTDELSCRPDFLIPIYAAYLADKKDSSQLDKLVRIDEKTPPTFLAVAWDDKTRGSDAALMLIALKKAGVRGEVHVYSHGGHGYGLRKSDLPASTWPRNCAGWMRTMGFLSPNGGNASPNK